MDKRPTAYRRYYQAILEAKKNGLLKENAPLTGFSGEKLIGALQRLARLTVSEENCYLEVGVFQGLTLLSVASVLQDKGVAYGIDNFAFFDPEQKNRGIIKQRRKSLGLNNAVLINKDYEEALKKLDEHLAGKKVGLYFVDGPHDYRSQLVCLLLIKPFLAERAVIVVDDCNYNFVRQANADFLQSHPGFKLFFEAYTPCHPKNMTPKQEKAARKGWWNGVNILVKDPENQLQPLTPKTRRNRHLFEQAAHLQSTRFPDSSRLGNRFANSIANKKWKDIAKCNWLFFKRYWSKNDLFPTLNAYSDDLVHTRFNPALEL